MFFDSIYNALSFIIDPIFEPILYLPPALAIFVISIIISLITTIAYKYMTDQEMIKRVKAEQKEMQKKIKENRDNPQKVMALQKEAMSKSTALLSSSFKPMLITMIPIILIFMWLNGHLSYLPIGPGDEFSTTMHFKEGVTGEVLLVAPIGVSILNDPLQVIEEGKVTWELQGEEGEHYLEYQYGDRIFQKDVLITTEKGYRNPVQVVSNSDVKSINIDMQKLKVNLGFMNLSWFWTYVIFTLITSTLMRKILKVY